MKSKVYVVLAILALVCWLPGQASATFFDCNPFYSTLSTEVSGDLPGSTGTNFAQLTITLTAANVASVTINPSGSYFLYDTNAFDLNVNAASFTVSNYNPDFTTATINVANPTLVDGMGKFNLALSLATGTTTESSTQNFNITNTSGTWASGSDVLGLNVALGELFLDGAHMATTTWDYEHWCYVVNHSGYVAEGCPPPVPVPPSALLMGSGLLGLVGLGWRRRNS